MRLSHFPSNGWVEIVVLCNDGIATTWANSLLMEVADHRRPSYTWDEFRTKMIQRFKSVTDIEEAHPELRNSKHIRSVVGHTQKFQELQSRLMKMT